MGGVTVAYSGVHQAFQIALAADEAGILDEFLCSLFVSPGNWGQRLAFLVGREALLNRFCRGISPTHVREYPWPFLKHRLKAALFGTKHERWTDMNPEFDRWAARQLRASSSQIIVGSETCARDSFQVAKEKGMVRILDAPQVEVGFLQRVLEEGYERTGLHLTGWGDSEEIVERKKQEIELADFILVYSEVHRRSFSEAGVGADRLIQIPLWADPELWNQPHSYLSTAKPLQALFVGNIGVRKGVPWLLEAAAHLGKQVDLTCAGPIENDYENVFQRRHEVKYVGRLKKGQVGTLYRRADVLVLPSLIDSFGFVAMEAMLSGLPVIVTENCGVPLPNDTWRVPVMDSEAIATRLQLYIDNPPLLERDGKIAQEFARQFTPARYRQNVSALLQRLLAETSLA